MNTLWCHCLQGEFSWMAYEAVNIITLVGIFLQIDIWLYAGIILIIATGYKFGENINITENIGCP